MAMSSHESYKNHNYPVRVELYDILEVDLERRIIRVEPGVNMGQITARLSPLGWTLPVVPELEDLTVGGLILGYGVETSSHKYGIFADLVDSYEVLLGTGEVVRASRESHAELFHALPWSRGTLGFLTAVELRIIPAKPWVRLEYHPVRGLDETCALFTKFACADNAPDFVEGFLYSVDTAVIVTGEFTDRSDADLINRVDRWYKPWYYEHVRSHLRIGPRIEYVPLREYYHRHSRSIFWVSELLVPFGNHPLFRYLLGWLMPPKPSFLKVT
ncbi:MAG: FAD-binding oxidoreductase, partial [Pseudonocardia sp.]|nr:FAD-binding oxidoreductase [Pseudonocardia sp.]